jgi:hypothetical protein
LIVRTSHVEEVDEFFLEEEVDFEELFKTLATANHYKMILICFKFYIKIYSMWD